MPSQTETKATNDEMDETAQLLSSPLNAQRLREAIAALDAGLGEEHDLQEDGGIARTITELTITIAG
jgi:hypothetical protein